MTQPFQPAHQQTRGATPMLPYGRHQVEDADVQAVVDVLRSDWLTTGPPVEQFENRFAKIAGTEHAVAVANGTAALHAMYAAAGVGPGDEVIVPSLTFVATANAVLYCGATPVLCDVDPKTLLVSSEHIRPHITPRTRAVLAVDFAGQPCDYDELRDLADEHGIRLLSDACHALGGHIGKRPVGSLADATAFSFHPVKHITTGEGGMVTTNDSQLAEALKAVRNHGITTDHLERERAGQWHYDMARLGHNYRLSGIHAALGTSQLQRLDENIDSRRALARHYDELLHSHPLLALPSRRSNVGHAYHLYVVRIPSPPDHANRRDQVFKALRAAGIGANVHYRPVHLHSYYQNHLGTRPGQCPNAENIGNEILTLPLWPGMTRADVERVATELGAALEAFT